MYRELRCFNSLNMALREILFSYYNTNSQIAHGRFHDWTKIKTQKEFDIYSFSILVSQFTRVMLLPIIACKEKGLNINNDKQQELQKQIDIIYKNLDGLIGENNE